MITNREWRLQQQQKHKLSEKIDSIFIDISFKMSSQVQNLQKQLLQLRQEANVQRIPVSQAIEE